MTDSSRVYQGSAVLEGYLRRGAPFNEQRQFLRGHFLSKAYCGYCPRLRSLRLTWLSAYTSDAHYLLLTLNLFFPYHRLKTFANGQLIFPIYCCHLRTIILIYIRSSPMGSVREAAPYLLITDTAMMTHGIETCSLTISHIHKLKVAHRVMERAMLWVSHSDIIRRNTKITDISPKLK